ncbi:hypothetical protein MJO28_007117 [Puccinia striiformis f. sp. tritici]|uniref:Uncharacterized protein n=1 Tax=Puccinia striiformis f. sp. tritici TaxID=168172 RepID=A0ACC0EES3_9BASI|nr:hypothetical protein MJO28_007117 [Puccinia striiformis f. sp. tritici]
MNAEDPQIDTDSTCSSRTSTISYPDRSDFPHVLSKVDIKEVIASLVSQRKTGKQIHAFLQEECGVTWSPATLNRKRAQWGLRNSDLPKSTRPPQLPPNVHASILSSHQQRFSVVQMRSRLIKDTGKKVSKRTVERYLAALQLTQRRDDIADGKVTRDQVKSLIQHARTQLLTDSAGYRRMRAILMHEYQTHVPRQVVYELLSEIDPQGMQDRLRHACKQRVFKVSGPNHIWSADGHDKLKPYGITIYGFVDAWSRKILGMYVHVTNNDPMHVGVYFLQLVTAAGGIPLNVTTDKGTETGDMAAYQIQFTQRYNPHPSDEAKTHMHFTKSVHNQKIESLWSRMMKEHNRSIIDLILKQIESGDYNPDDEIQKQVKSWALTFPGKHATNLCLNRLLFLFLWIPVVQRSVDRWVSVYNTSRKRKDKFTTLPTQCSPNFSYSTPEHFETSNKIIKVPQENVNWILEHDYPARNVMFTHTPDWFHQLASRVMQEMGFVFEKISLGGLWLVFDSMLPYIKANLPSTFVPSSC